MGAQFEASVRDQALDPGHRELLPVLWSMGLLPEVRVLGMSDFIFERERYADREAAMSAVLPTNLDGDSRKVARLAVAQHYDELFVPNPEGGYRRRPNGVSRDLLITWEANR
jgi:hypothetical protein